MWRTTGSLHNPATNHVCQEEGVGHYKFYCFPGRVTFFNKKYKGRAGRFYIHAHRDSSGPPPLLKNECSLKSSNNNDDGSQQTGLLNKWICVLSNSRSSILYCQVKLVSYGLHLSSKRKWNIRRRVFTSSILRRNSKFHVRVLWLTSKKCAKKRDARAMLLF